MLGVLLIVLGVLALRRGLAGYPAAGSHFSVLAPRELAFLQAAAETLFPPNASLNFCPCGRARQLPQTINFYDQA